MIDGYAPRDKEPTKNLADLVFAANESSYLVGVAAALKTKAKHVGFVGGIHGDLIKSFEAGYTAGVKSVDPKIKIDVQYLEDQNDLQDRLREPRRRQGRRLGDVPGRGRRGLPRSRQVGSGVFQAAAAAGKGKWAIGVDSDQYLTAPKSQQKPHILTSALKRIDSALYNYVVGQGQEAADGLRQHTT